MPSRNLFAFPDFFQGIDFHRWRTVLGHRVKVFGARQMSPSIREARMVETTTALEEHSRVGPIPRRSMRAKGIPLDQLATSLQICGIWPWSEFLSQAAGNQPSSPLLEIWFFVFAAVPNKGLLLRGGRCKTTSVTCNPLRESSDWISNIWEWLKMDQSVLVMADIKAFQCLGIQIWAHLAVFISPVLAGQNPISEETMTNLRLIPMGIADRDQTLQLSGLQMEKTQPPTATHLAARVC